MVSDEQPIADLLTQSRQAHQVYRDNVPRRVSDGAGKTIQVDGDALAAGLALWRACRFRTEARALDPEQTAAAWGDEQQTHDDNALLDFYVQQLTR